MLSFMWQETTAIHTALGVWLQRALELWCSKKESSTTPPSEFCPGNIYQPPKRHSGSREGEKLRKVFMSVFLFLLTLLLSSVELHHIYVAGFENVLLAGSCDICVFVFVFSAHSSWAIMSWSTKTKHEVNLSILKIVIVIRGHDIIMLPCNVLFLQPHEGTKHVINLTIIAHHLRVEYTLNYKILPRNHLCV